MSNFAFAPSPPFTPPDEVEAHNRVHPKAPESPVPHVFYAGWGSGRLMKRIQAVELAPGVEVEYYDYCHDDPESRKRDRELLEF